MRKKLTKLLAISLALFLAISAAIPSSVTAAAGAEQIKQQIRRTYSKARSSFGRSFDGYCGTLTGYQLYYMGLTAGKDRQNGKDGYDNYCNQAYSSGGYRIKAYSGKRWTLLQALNHITENGTKDAYNILVGFESTPSRAGRRYGHSCVIHGIIDGRVYFMESYSAYINGTRYREGTPISCTIAEFAAYYKSTTTKFDGVIHFGAKDYADKCDTYATDFEALVLNETQLRSQPCADTADQDSRLLQTLQPGQTLRVTAVLENDLGEFWYRIDGKTTGYALAQALQVSHFLFDDVAIDGISAPAALRQGRNYQIKGKITTDNNSLYSVRSRVFALDGQRREPVITTSDLVEDSYYNLKNSTIADNLAFRELTPGSYRYELAAIIGSYYYGMGQLQIHWETVSLWNSDFQVTEKKSDAWKISFDACGGSLSVNRIAVVDGDNLGTLPAVQYDGQVFLGWFTQKDGGERISEQWQPEQDTTLYARWSTPEALEAAADRCWYVYTDGLTVMGCAEINGELYYFTVTDPSGLGSSVWTATH